MSRCTGHCCKRFYLPLSPADLELACEAQRQKDAGDTVELWRDFKGDQHGVVGMDGEIVQIAGMVELVDTIQKSAITDSREHFYTCKNFDGQNCTIYESRPPMCRNYPGYNGEGHCNYPGCTYVPPHDESKLLTKAPEVLDAKD